MRGGQLCGVGQWLMPTELPRLCKEANRTPLQECCHRSGECVCTVLSTGLGAEQVSRTFHFLPPSVLWAHLAYNFIKGGGG